MGKIIKIPPFICSSNEYPVCLQNAPLSVDLRLDQNVTKKTTTSETAEQRDSRLQTLRLRNAEYRAAETTDQRESRLDAQQARTAQIRSYETLDQQRDKGRFEKTMFVFNSDRQVIMK